ncbi:hypothetical protein JTB14_003851 [Gonioctena quinquepunctata]|nr:hypothetical protein JTB14_003851 [Gonioctena quinquepunctata]
MRLEIVVNFDICEAVAAIQDTTIYFDLLECIFPHHHTADDDDDHDADDNDDDRGARTQPLLATYRYNWSHHVTTTGLTYLTDIIDARTSWQETPSKAAARRLYHAQIKLTYFNEGTRKDIIHYQHLKYLLTTEHPTLQDILVTSERERDDMRYVNVLDIGISDHLTITCIIQSLKIIPEYNQFPIEIPDTSFKNIFLSILSYQLG